MKRRLFVFAILLVSFSFARSPLRAQNNADVALGLTPYQSFHGGDIDAVNLTNGNLFVKIPLISYPQRGGKLNLGFSFVANGKDAQTKQVCPPKLACFYYWSVGPAQNSQVGIIQDQSAAQLQTWVPASGGQPGYTVFGVLSADSSTHPMVIATTGVYRSTDGTGYMDNETQQNPSATVVDRQGISYLSYYPATSGVLREDPNGNQISGSSSGYTDTLGRNIPPPPGTTTSSAGCTGPLPITSAVAWTPPGPGSGGTSPFKTCYVSVPISIPASSLGHSTVNGYSGSRTMAQSIVLPNGTAWTFQYNDSDPGGPSGENYGSLTEITLPTGGTISYTYFTSANCGPSLTRWIKTRTVNANDGTGAHTWTYFGGTSTSNIVTDPAGNDTVHTITDLGFCTPYETLTQYYQGSSSGGTLLKTIQTDYTATANGYGQYYGMWSNVFPIRVTTTWPNGKVTKTETDYDSFAFPTGAFPFGNVIAKREYDYGNGSPGLLLRTTTTNYLYASNSTYLTNNLVSIPSSVKVTDGGGTQRAYTTYGYDEYALANVGVVGTQHDPAPPDSLQRGNQTSVHRWLNGSAVYTTNCKISVSNGYLISYATYNDTGTINQSVDSCGTSVADTNHMTTFVYSATYAGAYPTTITNPKGQQTSHTYDFNTGLSMSTMDPNSQTSSFTYDNMWRIATASYPDGGLDTITRQETTPPFTATLTKAITSSLNYVTTNVFDGMGRVSQSQVTSDPLGTVYTDTTYDADGRKYCVSNPYRSTNDSTYGITTYRYDGVSRTTQLQPPDYWSATSSGSPTCQTAPQSTPVNPTNVVTTGYLGNTTTVTDQQMKSRTSQTDGLGRLTNVWEDPNGLNYQTVYTYDALDDLASVAQGGSRNRSFVFDSLKHMTSSTNPEAGTVTYAYDADSNVITKADARSITITYSYDTLNRMLGRTYSNGDPSVSHTYDQTTCLAGETACYNVGRRTSVTDAGGSEQFSYDKMGRAWAEQRTTNSITKSTTYTYNLDGSLATLTYPGGRVVTYAYSGAARSVSAIDTANSINYATLGTYAPQGALAGLTLGQAGSFAGINFTASYTYRLQPNELKASSSAGTAMDLSYNFVDANSHNNGNVMGITNNRDNTRSQSFSYDSLNRIAAAKTSSTSGSNCWGETYTVDQWANLTAIGAVSGYTGCIQESLSVAATTNNQLTATGFSYDLAGNMLGDAVNTYGWNAESEIKSAAGVNYTYDGDGNRVQKSNGKIYWYGAGTEILDESDASGNITDEYVFFGGKRVAHRVVSSGSISYYAEDFLGTSRAITTSAGTLCYDADFYPYGGERIITNTCAQNYKFEGKERDTETGNDDFGARYYTSKLGRWLSADWSSVPAPVPYANLTNPQTLNLYAMARDNPETFADLDGHYFCGPSCMGYLPSGGASSWAGDFSPIAGGDASLDAHGYTQSQTDSVHKVEAQNQDATKYRQEVVDTIKFQKDARAAYEKFGPGAKSVEELEQNVTKTLEKKYGEIGTAGSTNSSGQVEIKPDPNPYTREATARHEGVHKQTVEAGIAKYGKGTPAFNQWFHNPQNWAKDEVKAYSAGIAYLEQSLRKMDGP